MPIIEHHGARVFGACFDVLMLIFLDTQFSVYLIEGKLHFLNVRRQGSADRDGEKLNMIYYTSWDGLCSPVSGRIGKYN